MNTQSKSVDRRVKRSLQLLKQSFIELMDQKRFDSITIQDITDRADVNRGTFYAHFPDKYALLDSVIREQFQQLLKSQLSPTSGWKKKNLRILIQTVLEYFDTHCYCYPEDSVNPLFEKAVQDEIANLLLKWLKQVPKTETEWRVPMETIVLMISWEIFGVAIEWGRSEKKFSAEQMTNHVLTVITEGMTNLTPNGLID